MTNRAAPSSDAQIVAETTQALQAFADGLLAEVRRLMRAVSVRSERDIIWPVDEEGVQITRYGFRNPHYLAGVLMTLNSDGAPSGGAVEVDLELSIDGGMTFTSIFSAAPTIAEGAISGAAMVNLVTATHVDGAPGTITTTMAPAGSIIRCNVLALNGATGLNVQLGIQLRLDLGRNHLPTMAGFTPLEPTT